MKNQVDKVIVVSDVSERDGIGVEIFIDNELAVEIFRDDTDKTRTVTLFKKEISLELMEHSIEIFKKEIAWDFIESEEIIYLKFEAPKGDRKKIESDDVKKPKTSKAISFLKKIFPETNPDYENEIDEVKYWVVGIIKKSSLPYIEIGLNEDGKPIMIMPDDRNYGYWTDNNLKKEDFKSHFKAVEIAKEEFRELWNEFVNKKIY